MDEEKKGGSPNYEFPLNQRLLDETLKLKEERRILKERLDKIEKARGDVSEQVYAKVQGDYVARLGNVNDQLLAKKQDIDRELAGLYETRDKIQANLKSHKDVLEEIQLRHQLGEYSPSEFQKHSKAEEDKVSRFEQVLTGVENNVRRYETLFEGEEDLFGSPPPSAGDKPLSLPDEGEDEWEKEASEASNAAQGTDGAEWLEETKVNTESEPRLTITSGKQDIGKSFPINSQLTIGRSHTNQIVLKDAKVSRQHAEIKKQGEEFLLIDLNSSNGTLVNGQKVHEHILNASDEIQIGDFVMQFQQ